ncbi:MAG: hypothetical protein II886_07150 [Prevotella sp.]|nr:hypothetical protein [Prevotella sp.]
MKKMMIALVAMLFVATTGKAMSYEQARNEALFLTDKMAYELNLTDEQYEAAYEINLDYLMGVTSYDDVYATYWERRNLDMSYILLDWQWEAFCAASYFYRPLYWDGGYWHFGIYARYPHRDYFYFGRPVFYASYRGGHAWHRVGGHGWYYSRRTTFHTAGRSHFGMLDRWNRGDFRSTHRHSGSHHSTYGGNRISSTRTTVHNGRTLGNHRSTYESGRSFGSSRNSNSSYTGRSHSSTYNRGNSSYSGSSHSSGSFSGRSHSSGSFSGSRNSSYSNSGSFGSSPSRNSSSGGSFGGSRSSGSFSGGHSSSSHSSGGGGGHSSSGGRSFGGHR